MVGPLHIEILYHWLYGIFIDIVHSTCVQFEVL